MILIFIIPKVSVISLKNIALGKKHFFLLNKAFGFTRNAKKFPSASFAILILDQSIERILE